MKKAELLFLTILPTLVANGAACAKNTPATLTAAQQMEMKTLSGQLGDPGRSSKTKLEAAELLLIRRYPQAADALKGFLADSGNRPAQIAVAQAIAGAGSGNKAFVAPLMAMLTGPEPSVRRPAARALVTYKNSGVTERLLAIAAAGGGDKQVRLVVVSSLQLVLDKKAVDALVRLLDDPDADIRDAAAEALTKLTNIRAFGGDPQQWKRWWRANRHKDRSQWLADLTDNLARAKANLETENERLADRIGQVIQDLYAATPKAQREALLARLLKDPMGQVRLVGAKLADRKISANDEISDELRKQFRAMLSDEDARVREATALLVARLGDVDAAPAVLERLGVEEVAAVRVALLTALGQARYGAALPAVVAEIRSKYEIVAAAAAEALARIADKHPPTRQQRKETVDALVQRYQLANRASDGEQSRALREGLLTAMGVLGHGAFADVLKVALKDPAATVRLTAVNALAKLGVAGCASAIEPLVGDADRGVRQAAIAALGSLDGLGNLQTILKRIDPAVEPDAAVRSQAWDVTMTVLAAADAKTLSGVSNYLAERSEAADRRINILQMLVAALDAEKSPAGKLADAHRHLGLMLVEDSRPAEAAPHLGQAYSLFLGDAKAPGKPAAVWNEWLDALLAANNPQACRLMAEYNDDNAFARALERLRATVAELDRLEDFEAVILLAGEAIKSLPHRLTVEDRKELEQALARARAGQQAADTKRVATLVVQLTAGDESARKAAEEFQAMGDRAVRPLVLELKELVAAEKPNPRTEKALLGVLKQIAPKLNGYDPAATSQQRLKVIDSWLGGKP